MITKGIPPKNTDEYIAAQPEDTRPALEEIRKIILKAAPKSEEVISYQMPAFKYHGMLVYFAGYKNHVGFYPTPSGIAAFQKELSVYKNAKGSVQFPLDKPLPAALIMKMVKFRMKENEEKEKQKPAVKRR